MDRFAKFALLVFLFLHLANLSYSDPNADSKQLEPKGAHHNAHLPAPCPLGWIPFQDKKCFKVISHSFVTWHAASKICSDLDAHLPIIESQEEQKFLYQILFKHLDIVDNIWLGARQGPNSETFQWQDNSDFGFRNWSPKAPRSKAHYCVLMCSDESCRGYWLDVPCERKNLVVCQKKQEKPKQEDPYIPFLEELLNVRGELHDLRHRVDQMEKNPVPVGFIYTQYPSQPDPSCLWPGVKFEDITSQYGGFFFRAEGQDTASFGAYQEANSPRLEAVFGEFSYEKRPSMGEVDIPPEGWSGNVFAGYQPPSGTGQGWAMMRFKSAGGEVRPKNMAIRIWRRCNGCNKCSGCEPNRM